MLFKESMLKTENRAAERYELASDLSVVYEGDTEQIPVYPPDLSIQGMFINTPAQLPVGSVLKLHFRLVHCGDELNVRAEVRHCVPGVGVGVEFVDLSPEGRQAIEEEIRLLYPSI